MICLKDMPFFDGKYVGIGRVVDGMNVLDTINKVSTTFDAPDLAVTIVDIRVHAEKEDEDE
jgi:cyclophilin family peptidyl-prolyl cis-trans isomerase